MGTTIDIKPLTIPELHEVAKAAGLKGVPEKPKPKVLEAVVAGITDEQAQAALVKYGHAEPEPAPAAPDASSEDDTSAPTGAAPDAPTGDEGDPNAGAPNAGDPTPLGPPAVLQEDDLDEDSDEFESDGPVATTAPVSLPVLEGKHLPALKKAGATIKRIRRHTDGSGGEDPGSWWCPFTDYSKLKDGATVDQMPQSRAIRVVTDKLEDRPGGRGQRNVEYAVVLPPQGVPAGLLK